MNRIKALKTVDALLGRLAVRLFSLSPKYGGNQDTLASILIIRPGGIGDAVLLIPLIKSLKKYFPSATVNVLAERRNAFAFILCPEVNRVLHYDTFFGLFAVIRAKHDLVIDTEQWHRLSVVVARLCRPKTLIGFGTNERKRLFTYTVPYSHDDYEVTSFLKLLKPLGVSTNEPKVPFLTVPEEASVKAAELLVPLAGKRFAAIFPGASIPERRWGAERYHLLAKGVFAAGYSVVVVGGKEDREQGNEIISGGMGLNLAGLTSLAETAAVLERSSLLISGDSGVLHIAVGLDIPTVSLFGPGIAAKWAPRGKKHIVLNRNLPCSPCTKFGTTPSCPRDARCMKEITADQVMEAAVRLLQKH